MGYDLHITRKNDWSDEAGLEISVEEWLLLVEADPELRLDLDNSPCFAVWSGPGAYECWLDYADGDVYTKNPTPEFIEKMVQLAEILQAKVQGDDGEVYLRGGMVL